LPFMEVRDAKEIEVESEGLIEDGHLRKDGSRDKIMVAVAANRVDNTYFLCGFFRK